MEISRTASSSSVEVIPATPEQQPIVANLLQLYIHDFSELIDVKLGADGRYAYEPLLLYWKAPDRYPFLVRVDGHWAGFALVQLGSQVSGAADVWDMGDFFTVRGYRRLGVGTKAAHAIWKSFPGKWEIRVIVRNQNARRFWDAAIREFAGKTIHPELVERGDRAWHVFSFECQGTGQPG